MTDGDRPVAIGFLSQRDLETLGKTFTRHFLLPNDDAFADLLAQLDAFTEDQARDGARPPSTDA